MESSAKELVLRQLDGLELGTPDSLSWNTMVANNAASGFMQSIEWAQFKHNQGLKHMRLGIYLGDELLAGCIFYYAADSNPGFLVSPHGPILPWQNQELSRNCLGLIIGAAEQLAKEESLIGLRIEPLLPVPVPDLLLEFGRSPIDLLPKETLCLDFHSKTGWAKAHKLWSTLLHLAVIGAGFAIMFQLVRGFDAFYMTLIGLAIGYRISGNLTARATKRAQIKELTSQVEAALIDHAGAASVDINLDVSAYPSNVLDDRVAVLVKDGYTVSTVKLHNDKTVTLKITGRRSNAK